MLLSLKVRLLRLTVGATPRLKNDEGMLLQAFAPAGYGAWRGIADANKGDVHGARFVRKECHDRYRERYRAELRGRPLQ